MTNGAALQERIQAKGYTLEEVAKEIGIRPATLQKKAEGRSEFRLTEIKALAALLELTPRQMERIFFDEANYNNRNN